MNAILNESNATDENFGLRQLLCVIGFTFGVETIGVNSFAVWFFYKTSNWKNVHTKLVILKMVFDLPMVLIMTFFWLPLSYFNFATEDEEILKYLNVFSTIIGYTTCNLALNTQLHIVITRFVAVFYTFCYERVFRTRYFVLALIFSGFMAVNEHAIGSLYRGYVYIYVPAEFGVNLLSLRNMTVSEGDTNTSWVVSLVYFWTLILACLALAFVTMCKLRLLNNEQNKGPGIHKIVKRKRRLAEWKLLVMSVATPIIMSVQAIGAILSEKTDFNVIDPPMLDNFVFNWLSELIVVQSFAIVQLCINPSFWRFVSCQGLTCDRSSGVTIISSKTSGS